MIAKPPMRWRYPSGMSDSTSEESPSSWREWRRLCNLMPELDRMHIAHHYNQKPPPRPMTDAAFLALVSCFADPVRRRIVATLLWDLLGKDIVKLIKTATEKET